MSQVAALQHGRIELSHDRQGGLVARGIPFAASPVGALRFAPPSPPPSWSGVRSADTFGPACPQNPSALGALGGGRVEWDEAGSLTLNVWTPSLPGGTGSADRPVLVFLHGGAFVTGSGRVPWYDGSRLARRGDAVVVTCNYRLGAFGWAAIEGVCPGNLGLADQIAALTWVRDNIAAFGGDPDDVTVFGESAGAMSVAVLLGTPAADGLFRRAILQSGAASHVASADDARETGAAFVRTLAARGCTDVRTAPAAELLAAQAELIAQSILRNGFGMPFVPNTDGALLPEQPLDRIRAGRAPVRQVLLGTNLDEMRLYSMLAPELGPATDEKLLRRVTRMVGDADLASRVVDLYRRARPEAGHADVHAAIATDWVFRQPALTLADALHGAGSTVHVYEFRWRSPAFGGRLGSCHALELPFVFDTLDAPGVEMLTGDGTDRAPIADAMSTAWLAFARGDAPRDDWERHDPATRPVQVFDTVLSTELDPRREERLVWAGRR